MTERTQDDDGPGAAEPEKVHTFDLIDTVPGISAGTELPDDELPHDELPSDELPDDEPGSSRGDPSDGEHETGAGAAEVRAPGRVARLLTEARAAVGRTARRGAAGVRRRLPTTRRGTALLVGGTALAVVLAVVAAWLVDAQLRERALIAAPGGVRSLETKPGELWSVDLDNPIDATLVEMSGVLAIVGDGKVRGVDPASGAVGWTVDVTGNPSCGPATATGQGGPGAAGPADPLVCVTTPDSGSQAVTVIEPDGTSTTREIDPDVMAQPLPDGGLLLLELTGGAPERRPVVVDKMGAAHLPKGFEGPDLQVLAEDARTGAERWSETVEFDAPRPEGCVTYEENEMMLDVAGVLGWQVRGDVVEVAGCGVSAAFLADGTRLDDPADPQDPPAAGVGVASYASLPGGGWVGPDAVADDAAPHDVVHLPEAAPLALDGQVLVPWSTDGRDPGLLLERADARTVARSTDDSELGARLWTADRLTATTVLARVSGTTVLVDDDGSVRAVDLGTGADLWALDPETLSLGDQGWATESLIFGAFTDGETLLLPVAADPDGSGSGLRLLAVDLQDGSVRWEIVQETPYTQLVSVDGYLAQITQQGVVGLG